MSINYQYNNVQSPTKITLSDEQTAGHADHWHVLTSSMQEEVPTWLQQMIEHAAIPKGLNDSSSPDQHFLLLSTNEDCHINQVLAMEDGRPKRFVNAYPCVNSPYGMQCQIERIIVNETSKDAVLRCRSEDGSIIYAFDQLYTTNRHAYRQNTSYFINFSAWAYQLSKSDQSEVVRVEDPEGIRYHRAFNDIIAKNNGEVPDDINEQIKNWQPEPGVTLAPVEINLGNMCAYLFGETLGQEDEAWCQGQVLGKKSSQFHDKDITLFDVAILREPDARPFVVRIAAVTNADTQAIQVNDYIQANIWLQAALYAENQTNN